MKTLRCAIYTRKSSEEGLEQDFNSLDAQREACAAYILSQASEGWTALPDHYDDGGISGGTLERPGLKRLLADVAAGRVDVIVVYKVDRLSRSLFDFAKLVEAFEKAGTSFVSVTQSFNTTTSMGRLTLNMLLSFAQFEREVTAERIRDKIAASKAKGMWMGGNPPVGYQPDGRSLKIVESEADQVRDIFGRYLRLSSVRLVERELIRDRVTTPPRVNGKGRAFGGCNWSRGQIYKLLSNPIYLGLIEHKGERYQGLHQGIIDTDTWEHAQAKLAESLQGKRGRRSASEPSLLAGKVEDETGTPLISDHATSGTVRYRYYATRREGGDNIRVPARELELIVIERITQLLEDPIGLASAAGLLNPTNLRNVQERASKLGSLARDRPFMDAMVIKVRVLRESVEIICSTAEAARLLGAPPPRADTFTLTTPARVKRTGRVVRLIDANGSPLLPTADTSLVKLIAKAHRWWAELRKGELNISELGAREGVQPAYLTRTLRLAFLSPKVVEAIMMGRHSTAATVGELTIYTGVPARWDEQDRRLISR